MPTDDPASNLGFATIYEPDNGQKLKLAAYFHQQNEAELQRQQQRDQAIQAHQFALDKYYGNQFDPKDFDTNTALDEQINDYLAKGHQQVSEAIQNKIDGADLDRIVQQSLAPAIQLHQKGSLIKSNIDATATALKPDKGIDTDALRKEATLRALYNRSPDGKYTIKNMQDLAQVDPEHDYSKDILDQNPELVSTGGVDVEGKLAKMIPQNFKSSGSYYSSPGVKRKGSFEANYFQGAQKLTQDPDGAYKVVTADNPIVTKDATGNPVTIHQVPDEVLSHFSQTVGDRAALDVATKKYLTDNNLPALQPGSQGFDQAKKAMLYDQIENIGPKKISETHDVTTAPIVIKNELGLINPTPAQPAIQNQTGFDKISNVPFYQQGTVNGTDITAKGGTINNGTINNLPPGTNEVKIRLQDLPEEYRGAAKKLSSDNDITGDKNPNDNSVERSLRNKPTGYATLQVVNGNLTGIKTDKGTFLTPDDLNTVQTNELNKTLPMKQKIHPAGTKSIAEQMRDASNKKEKLNW